MNKTLTLSLEEARQIYGKDSTMDKLLLSNFTKEELEQKSLPKSWEELNIVSGYSINTISRLSSNTSVNSTCRNLFKTEKQALSALAKAQLSQPIYVYNEGWEPDWKSYGTKYCITRYKCNIECETYDSMYQFLAFKSQEIRDEFLRNFEPLIKQYFEL